MKVAVVVLALFAAAMARNCHEHLQQAQNNPNIGGMRPVCRDDGTYHPKQTLGSTCFCVNKEGYRIENYVTPIYQCKDVTCNCARDKHEYKQLGMLGKIFKCDARGNYEPVQCTGSVCYCVDEAGQRLLSSKPVHVSQIHTLQC